MQGSVSSEERPMRYRTHAHLYHLVALAEVGIEDGLPFWQAAVLAYELAVDADSLNLRKRQLVRIQIARREWAAKFEDLVQTAADGRELVRYRRELLADGLGGGHQTVDETVAPPQIVKEDLCESHVAASAVF